MTFPSADELEKEVYVSAQEPITEVWDGREYNLSTEPIRVAYGVVYHWQNKGHELTVSDVPNEHPAEREIVNPLEANDRGVAFAGLKRPGRKKASGE